MAEEETGGVWGSWPDAFRKVMERLERAVALPAGSSAIRILRAGDEPAPVVQNLGEGEPTTDLIESPNSIFVTIELPGVSRADIDLQATQTTLVVSASSPLRRYHREVELPAPVRVDSIIATYKNGVLDVVLEKADRARRVFVR
ncbi:MAG TPA: Hsp20/alpha crystallin family protein [Thermoplasmata archaeon]|nr:Hsp20/alpha crystallin family protein [Thermoplasmata archaeon]